MKHIIKHVIDCLLAFGISLFSILGATGNLTGKDFLIALVPSILVGLIKFRDFWNTEMINPKKQTPTIFL